MYLLLGTLQRVLNQLCVIAEWSSEMLVVYSMLKLLQDKPFIAKMN